MKGKIFIGWSGSNSLAKSVKLELEKEDYTCVVGGQGGISDGLFVGQAVLLELNQCDQAIFVIEKKKDGTISNNLMFELGYALARYKQNKLHQFYVGIEERDIPSDIRGAWATHTVSKDKQKVVDEIVKGFLADQKHIISEDKMVVVNDYYNKKEMMLQYSTRPFCSEYELAQYVLFYSQAAYMFHNENEGVACLEHLAQSIHRPSFELEKAISAGICYLRMLLAIQKEDDIIYLKNEDFRQAHQRLTSIRQQTDSLPKNDFSRWLHVIVLDAMNYASILHSACPKLQKEKRDKILNESIQFANECLMICEELMEQPSNVYFVELYIAYMYRNIATAKKALNYSSKEVYDELTSSYMMRKKLWEYYNEAKRINERLLDTFEMEYYLTLSERLEYMEDSYERDDSKEDCEEYIARIAASNCEKTHFINKIERNIAKVKTERGCFL